MYDKDVIRTRRPRINLTLVYQSGGLVLAHNKNDTRVLEQTSSEKICTIDPDRALGEAIRVFAYSAKLMPLAQNCSYAYLR